MHLLNIKQYSRKVKTIKRALIIIGGSLLASIAILPFSKPHEQRVQISYTKSIDEEGRMRLINPVLYGMDGKRQAFKILAESGLQLYDGKEASFKNISGEMSLSRDNSKIKVSAKQCKINGEGDELDLIDDVYLHSSNEYTAYTKKATISLKSSDIWSDTPIEMKSKSGKINADKFYFESDQKIMIFEGHVITIVD